MRCSRSADFGVAGYNFQQCVRVAVAEGRCPGRTGTEERADAARPFYVDRTSTYLNPNLSPCLPPENSRLLFKRKAMLRREICVCLNVEKTAPCCVSPRSPWVYLTHLENVHLIWKIIKLFLKLFCGNLCTQICPPNLNIYILSSVAW